jgi:hypothetical protein
MLRTCYHDTSKHYRYGKFANYNTGNAIATLFTITGTVIDKITIPVFANYNTGNAIATLFTITGTVIGIITIPVMPS